MTTVVLIKSESDGPDKFVQLLKKHDLNVVSISSIDFQYKNLDKLCDKLKNNAVYDGIVFTSPRAVYATQKAIGILSVDWSVKKFNYCVGQSTSKLVEELLKIRTKGSDTGNALKLSSLIINDYAQKDGTKNILFPCSNLRQDILEINLRKNSINLDVIEVYETVQHPNLEESIKNLESVDFLVFFSPSSVNYSMPFINSKLDMSKIKVVAIGPSTAKCLTNNDMKCDGVCEKPSPESLLELLQSL